MLKKKEICGFLLLSLILGFTFLATFSIFHSAEGRIYIYSRITDISPSLNGAIGASEWEDANVYENVGNDGKFDVFLMHDDNYFYIGIRVTDASKDDAGVNSQDRIALFFDEGDDGGFGSGSSDEVLTSGQEDYKSIEGDGTLQDGYWFGPDPIYWYVWTDATPDAISFEADIAYHTNRWEAEFKIPFVGDDGVSSDTSDLDIDVTDYINVLIRLRDYHPVDGFQGHYWYPEYEYTTATDVDIQADPSLWMTLAFDNEAPTISNVQISPSDPGSDDSVTVSADVTDDVSGILDVTLRYSINGGASWSNVLMISGSAYSGVIPQQAEGTVVQYKIVARDNAGFTKESAVSSYSVQEEAPPPAAPGIPGFPLEGIALAMIIAAAVLSFFRKREQMTSVSI